MHCFVFFQVVPQLLLPEEVSSTLTSSLVEIVYNISVVNFYGDESHNNFSQDSRNFTPNDSCQLLQLIDDDIEVVLKSLSCVGIISDGIFGHHGPNDLGSHCHNLTGLSHDPIYFFLELSLHPFVESQEYDPLH